MMQSKLKKDRNSITVRIALFSFKEEDTHIVYSPELDITGYGETEKEAQESFDITLEEFFRYTNNKKTLEQELERLGWKMVKRKKTYKIPKVTDIISSTNPFLKDIINNKEYGKTTKPLNVPAVAAG